LTQTIKYTADIALVFLYSFRYHLLMEILRWNQNKVFNYTIELESIKQMLS